jgi:Uma2 family endonuclease
MHQSLLGGLFTQMHNFFAGKPCRPYIAPIDMFLPEGDEPLDDIEHVVQPDAFVVCDTSKLIDEGVRGTPDFIIEVLSPELALKARPEDLQDIVVQHGRA